MTVHVGHGVISYGSFFNTVVSFLITAAVVYYFLVAPTARIMAYAQRNQATTQRECPECLSQIPVAARRCMYCTCEVKPASQQSTADRGPSPVRDVLGRVRQQFP